MTRSDRVRTCKITPSLRNVFLLQLQPIFGHTDEQSSESSGKVSIRCAHNRNTARRAGLTLTHRVEGVVEEASELDVSVARDVRVRRDARFVAPNHLSAHLNTNPFIATNVVTSQTISWVSQKRLLSEAGISLFIESFHAI